MNWKSYYAMASLLLDNKEESEAIKQLQIGIKNASEYEFPNMCNFAMDLYDSGEFNKSLLLSTVIANIVCIRRFRRLALFNKGNCHQKLNQYQQAEEVFSEIINLYPNDSDAYFNRANARTKLGKIFEANQDNKRVREMENNADLGSYFSPPNAGDINDRKLDDFLSTTSELELKNPYNIAQREFERGNSFVKIREFKRAIECFKNAINNYPIEFYESAQLNLISCYWDLKENNEELIKEIKFFLKYNPDNPVINEYKKELGITGDNN